VSSINLTNHFLIAMPAMADPHFSRTLTYICEHTPQGALGVVVNRPIDMRLSDLFARIALESTQVAATDAPVWYGGPVQTDRGFVLHSPTGTWGSTLKIGQTMGLTTSKDILEAVASGAGPQRLMVTLGYAGWSAGQLEQELAQNAWLTVAAPDDAILFDTPADERLPAAMRLLGLDYARLSDVAGHA
jgi:putative transcriptional regulator